MGFKINALEITCPLDLLEKYGSLYKNLKSKFYLFNDFYELSGDNNLGDNKTQITLNPQRNEFDSFFEKRSKINIQAIIGKNGSGKSSLMDLMYMAINNFAFLYINGFDRKDNSEHLYFIPGVYVSLYFSDENGIYILTSLDDKIILSDNHRFNCELHLRSNNSLTDSIRAKIVEHFFYSIVSNYSLQSFIPDNYRGVVKQKINGDLINIEESWINQVFNKNDGYARPLVLNPYRGDGIIDLTREMNLSKDRLISSLIFSKNQDKSEIIPFEYELDHIDYQFNPSFLLNKVNHYFNDEFLNYEFSLSNDEREIYNFTEKQNNDELFQSIEYFFGEDTSITDKLNIFFHLRLGDKNNLSEIQKNAIAYLLYKMFWISRKYKTFKQYYGGFVYESGKLQISDEKQFKKIANKIRIQSSSHIVKKAHRILKFLEISTQIPDKFEYFQDYLWKLKKSDPIVSPMAIDWTLPPSIFSYDLFLKKNDSFVNYKNLSSGQIQLLQTISVHLYHIGNVISNFRNNDNKELYLKYDKINLVFDEVEICFHPEFQRIFIKYLISMIENLNVLSECSINIFILSHSPFILSDIPKGRVLYLEDGKMNTKKINKSTFAGNIGEMIYESFFMDSAVGAFAEEKIKELIEYKKDSTKTSINYNMYIQNISDPVIKSLIEEIEECNDKN